MATKKKANTQLATRVTGDLALAAANMFDVEGATAADMSLSYLKLFHGTTDEVANFDEPPTFDAGSWYDSVSQKPVDVDRPFVVAHGKKEYLVWEDNVVVARAGTRGELDPDVAAEATETWTFAILFEDSDTPYVLSMKSTSIKAAKKMFTTMRERSNAARAKDGEYLAPAFALSWKMDKNNEGKAYRRVVVTLSPAEVGPEWLQRALEWGQKLKSVNFDEVAKDQDGKAF